MIPAKLRKQVIERSGGRCEVCHSLPDWRGMQIHHVSFKQMGGSKHKDTLDNLLALCAKCHSLKHGVVER